MNHANILVLQKKDATGPARIVEVGSHAELLALGGVYSDLVKFQSKSRIKPSAEGSDSPKVWPQWRVLFGISNPMRVRLTPFAWLGMLWTSLCRSVRRLPRSCRI